MEDIEEDSLTKLEAIGVVSVVLIGGLLCYIVVYRRKRNKLKKEYDTCIENLDKALVELDVIRNKEKESRKIIASELHKHRSEVKKLTEIADMYSVKLLVMLTKKNIPTSDLPLSYPSIYMIASTMCTENQTKAVIL